MRSPKQTSAALPSYRHSSCRTAVSFFFVMEATYILLLLVSQFCHTRGDELSCHVTQTAKGTLYTVIQVDTGQDFFWSNSTDHTLAFRDESLSNKMEQVVNYNETSLLLKECEEVVLYKTNNLQGDEHTAKCSTICRKKQPEPAGRDYLKICLSLGTLGAALLVVIVLIVCCCWRSNGKHDFSKVSTLDEPAEPDPEAAQG